MSKVFDEYAKIAEERGLLSKEAYPMDKRVDSRSLSDIELLYGVKPNGEKDDMIEKAHPGVAVVSPSYDRMDGIVENQNQQHAIMTYIAMRPPNGNYQQKRFVTASNELVESLVRIGFMLDSKNEEDLMKLADSCAGRIQKKAIAPLAIGLMVGIPLLLGAIGLINRTSNSRQNVINNAESVLRELEDLQGKMDVSAMANDIRFLQNAAHDFESKAHPVQVTNVHDVLSAAETNSEAIQAARRYKIVLDMMTRRLPKYVQDMKAAESRDEYKPDWWQKIEDVGRYILSVTTDTEDVVNALEGLQKAVAAAKEEADHIIGKAHEAAPSLEAELAAYEQSGGVEKTEPQEMLAKVPVTETPGGGPITQLVNKTVGV